MRTAESPTIVVASKSAVDNNIQPIFNLFTTGNTILKSSRKFGAFIGFGETATPITVLPKMLFSFSSQKFVPPFKDLLLAESKDDFKNLKKKLDWTKMRIPNHAILAPAFSEFLLDSSEIASETMLVLMTDLIRSQFIQENIRNQGTDEENFSQSNQEMSCTVHGPPIFPPKTAPRSKSRQRPRSAIAAPEQPASRT